MVSKRNSEGYFDPTAYEALVKIEREAKRTRTYRPLVYVCSPLSGDIAANQENARRYCRSVVERGGIPLAPHLLFPQFMDDTSAEERDLAIFGKKMRPLQVRRKNQIEALGFLVYCIDRPEQIGGVLNEIQSS